MQHSIGSPSHSNWTRKRKTRYPDWNGRGKLALDTDDMILYIENTEDTKKKLLELVNEFSKVAGYMVNIQILVAFLYTKSNEISEKVEKQSLLKFHPKNKKILSKN